MKIREYVVSKLESTKTGVRIVNDVRFRMISKAVISLVFNLLFAFYNGILGVVSSSIVFVASSVYYLLLSVMRFSIVMPSGNNKPKNDRQIVCVIGIMLIILSFVFHIMVIISMKYQTAAVHGTITMIAIATFTFSKITAASVTAVKHRHGGSKIFKALNSIRYSEVAVSLLTMQQSMLVTFGEADGNSNVILNAFTGAGVCFFILTLGIITFNKGRREG